MRATARSNAEFSDAFRRLPEIARILMTPNAGIERRRSRPPRMMGWTPPAFLRQTVAHWSTWSWGSAVQTKGVRNEC